MQPTPQMLSSVPFQYANDVRAGRIITGKRIKQSVERFFDWIDNAESKNYILDHHEAIFIVNLFPTLLSHTSGDLAGTAFLLSPYQQFTFYNIFGWKRFDNKGNKVRVIRKVYEKVARKNGKTAALAGLGLICQAFDNEKGAEVYVGATMEKQAKLVWTQAINFIKKSRYLKDLGYTYTQSEIRFENNLSVFKPVSKQFQNLDGLRPSLGILDEYHSHATDGVKEVIESGMGSRLEPILYTITTAGTNVASVCKNYEDVCKEILDGDKQDDSTFIMIHDLDEGDVWEDESVWIKANPNLDVSVSLDYLRTEFQSAKNQPSKIPNFKTKYLNMWVDAPTIWIPNEIWKRNEIEKLPLEKFKEFGSYAGLDMSTTTDFTALAVLSEPDDEEIRYLKVFLFCPKDTIARRSLEDRVPYQAWFDQGYIHATPGEMIDHKEIFKSVVQEYHNLNVKRVEIDRALATNITSELMDSGVNVSWFTQTIYNYSAPTKEFETLIYNGKIKYEYNPALEWMLSGCIVISDTNENIRVAKDRSHKFSNKRVDGIIASIMALGGSLSPKEEKSKYEKPLDESEIYI